MTQQVKILAKRKYWENKYFVNGGLDEPRPDNLYIQFPRSFYDDANQIIKQFRSVNEFNFKINMTSDSFAGEIHDPRIVFDPNDLGIIAVFTNGQHGVAHALNITEEVTYFIMELNMNSLKTNDFICLNEYESSVTENDYLKYMVGVLNTRH